MKRLNQILIVLVAAIAIFCIVFHFSGNLKVEVSGVAASAADHVDTYNSVLEILKAGTSPQTFTTEIPSSPDDIYLVATTITLSNKGFLDANWVEATVVGASGDIAVYSLTGANCDIPKGGTDTLTLKLISRTPSEIRKMMISYYIMGVQRTITVNV